MFSIAARIIALLMGYFAGTFPTGYLYGKSKGIDIRNHGSGNSGTTNTLRILGWKAGAVTFLGDSLKVERVSQRQLELSQQFVRRQFQSLLFCL